MPRLDVPVEYQSGEKTCLLQGIHMILNYYDAIPDDIDDLMSTETDHVGTYLPQIGAWLERHGYDTSMITAHPELFTQAAQDMDVSERNEHVLTKQPSSEQDEKVLGYFEDYVANGGRITYEIPGMTTIQRCVDAGHPVGACATTHFKTETERTMNFHFLVVTGYDEDYVYVNDPKPPYTEDGTARYTHEAFTYAVHATVMGDLDNGSMFVVKP